MFKIDIFFRIQPLLAPESSTPSQGLKIKIPKDKIKTEAISELAQAPPVQPSIGIKLKIPKDKLNNCVSLETNNRKRERERNNTAETPPSKIAKMSHKSDSSKQNGRHSYNRVSTRSGIPPQLPPKMMFPPPPPPPPPAPVLYYPQMPPPGPPALPNMSVPPPNYYPNPRPMFPYYPHQGYMYSHEMYGQPPLPPNRGLSNPPLPTEAPPCSAPPPPPPE